MRPRGDRGVETGGWVSDLRFTLNDAPVAVQARPGDRLYEVLREGLGSRDVKVGCAAGDCGSCTVLIDGAVACACLVPVQQVAGARVDTLAGLTAQDPVAQDLVERFQDHGAAQCGICTPGMMVAATALLRDTPDPSENEVKDALGGVLCRCTGYRKIIDAVMGRPGMAQDAGDIGQSARRLDGARKVTGVEIFGDDVAAPGTLRVRVVRSPFSHATFTFGDLEGFAARTEGIAAVLIAADIPGRNRFGVLPGFEDQPVFAEARTRFRGEAVAAMAGTEEALIRLADADFPVTWHEEAAIATLHDARAPGAALVHAAYPENVLCRGRVQIGDAEAALAAADVVADGEFTTSFVEHGYIEPEAGVARVVEGRLEVQACTQSAHLDRAELAGVLDMPVDRIRVLPTAVGGGFGSKLDLSVQPYLALAALKTGRTVRMAYTRVESMQSTTKRHPARITMKIGARADGRLSGIVFDGIFNTGAYASWGPTVADRVPIHASGPYRVADFAARTEALFTDNPPSGAFRGFGVPQAAIAQEQLFDDLAAQLGMDVLEFRILNALEDGVPTVCGQVLESGVGIKQCLEALRPAWAAAKAEAEAVNTAARGPLRRGVGLGAGWYGCGNTSVANPSTIRCGVRADGRVVLHQGAIDIGQGSDTVIPQIFASALGVATAAILCLGADTDQTPDAGKTSASRQTFVTGKAAEAAAQALRQQILRLVNASETAQLRFGEGHIAVEDPTGNHRIDLAGLPSGAEGYVFEALGTYNPPTSSLDAYGQGAPYAQYGYAAQVAVVEVDLDLGTVRPLQFVAAHDVGRAINPMLVEGQIHGGIAQGLGMALMEEYLPGRTENLHDYLIPTIGDVPPIETRIVEVPDAHGPMGANGLGEHALIPTAPALLNAIHFATGVRFRHVPVTPSRLRDALRQG